MSKAWRRGMWLAVLTALVLAVSLLALACGGGGVSQSDYDTVKQQLTTKEKEAADVQQKLSVKEKEAADKTKEAADLQKKAQEGFLPVLGVKAKTPVTPTPAPTLPPGVTATPPPPAATVPPSYSEKVDFAWYVEPLAAFHGDNPVELSLDCVASSLFKRGMEIVWRFEITDISTGKRVLTADVDSVKLRLQHGEELTARFSKRGGAAAPPDTAWMWAAAWDIPISYPFGALDYVITVAMKDGRTGTFNSRSVALVNPASKIDTRLMIIE